MDVYIVYFCKLFYNCFVCSISVFFFSYLIIEKIAENFFLFILQFYVYLKVYPIFKNIFFYFVFHILYTYIFCIKCYCY